MENKEKSDRKYEKWREQKILTGRNTKEIKEEKVTDRRKIDKKKKEKEKREEERRIKEKIEKAADTWWKYHEKGGEETEEEERSEGEEMNTIQSAEVVSNAVTETYIRKGPEASRKEEKGEAYTIKDYTIMDINWGQYTEIREGKYIKGKKKQAEH